MTLRLHTTQPRPGSRRRKKRLGSGESSGLGKTSGRGHTGAGARAGFSMRPGFEGGQMPLFRRLPKRGFNNAAFTKRYCPVNVGDLEKKTWDGVVDEKALRQAGLVGGRWAGVKILGTGELKQKLELEVHQVSASAKEKIEKAGGSVKILAAAAPEAAPAKAKKPAPKAGEGDAS
ncbi:MAG: 50S ribosomal protein L15 [Verrucomicrobiota bacterium]